MAVFLLPVWKLLPLSFNSVIAAYCRSADDYNELTSHQLYVNSVSHGTPNTRDNYRFDYVTISGSDVTNRELLQSAILSRRNAKERKRVRYTVIIAVIN